MKYIYYFIVTVWVIGLTSFLYFWLIRRYRFVDVWRELNKQGLFFLMERTVRNDKNEIIDSIEVRFINAIISLADWISTGVFYFGVSCLIAYWAWSSTVEKLGSFLAFVVAAAGTVVWLIYGFKYILYIFNGFTIRDRKKGDIKFPITIINIIIVGIIYGIYYFFK